MMQRMTRDSSDSIRTSDEVATALAAGKPVVALESTIITHGMPAPENLQTAQEVETIVRAGGAGTGPTHGATARSKPE